MNLERLGSITSELSTSLLKSIVVPQGGLPTRATRTGVPRGVLNVIWMYPPPSFPRVR